MSDCVDTFPVVTRLKLDRTSLAESEAARAGTAVAAAISTIMDTLPSACMDFVISVAFPRTPQPRVLGWPRLGVYMLMLRCSINILSGFYFRKLSVRVR